MDRSLERHRSYIAGAVVAAALLLFAATGCTTTVVRITTDPSLFPVFSVGVTDYVSRCDASKPVQLSIDTPPGTSVSVDGGTFQSGTFTASVTRSVGERFPILVRTSAQTTTHYVRCLPADFPTWTAQRTGRTQAQWYVTGAIMGADPNYPAIFDNNGVPVWWGPKTLHGLDLLLPDGNIAWNVGGSIEEHRFDGSLVRTYNSVGDPIDAHDLVVLPNGDHVVATDTPRPHIDLSSWGGPSDTTIVDHVLQEVTPSGQVVWSWTASQHLSVTETGPVWRAQELKDPGGPFSPYYDPFHYNSVESTGDGFLLSFRHLDAIFKIDKASGNVVWKMGGTPRPESLRILGDPVFQPGGGGGFGGQHDARLLSDGTITLYDDGSGRNRPPRAVRYAIDTSAGTATLVQHVSDPLVQNVTCCGSARALPGGNYVFGWGGNADSAPDVSETTNFGVQLFELRFTAPNAFVYRAFPVLPGQLSADALRTGMDTQYGG